MGEGGTRSSKFTYLPRATFLLAEEGSGIPQLGPLTSGDVALLRDRSCFCLFSCFLFLLVLFIKLSFHFYFSLIKIFYFCILSCLDGVVLSLSDVAKLSFIAAVSAAVKGLRTF